MSPTDTGNAMKVPPPNQWVQTAAGVEKWRAVISRVTVERIRGESQARLLWVSDGEREMLFVLSAEDAAHLAALLVAA